MLDCVIGIMQSVQQARRCDRIPGLEPLGRIVSRLLYIGNRTSL